MKLELNIIMPNLTEALDKLTKAPDILKQELADAINESLKNVWAEAWVRTPYLTGALRGSYKEYKARPDELIGILTPTKEYALKQHEHLEYRHPRGGEAKYLENAIKARQEQIKSNFFRAIDNTLQKITS